MHTEGQKENSYIRPKAAWDLGWKKKHNLFLSNKSSIDEIVSTVRH